MAFVPYGGAGTHQNKLFTHLPKRNSPIANLRYAANICDSRFDSGGYCRRLEKYDYRGFQIGIPGFNAAKVSSRVIVDSEYVFLTSIDALLRVQSTDNKTKDLALMISDFSGTTVERTQKRLRGTSIKTCEAVRGFERPETDHRSDRIREDHNL